MNENLNRSNWITVPPERVPTSSAIPEGALWRPPPGYPHDDAQGGGEGSFASDIHRYAGILFRHKWVVLGVLVVFLGLGSLFTFLSTPVYRSMATIQIDREPAKVVNLEEAQADLGSDVGFYATQYEILKSRSLAERIISTLSVEELLRFTQQNVLSPWVKLRQLVERALRPEENAEPTEDIDVAALQKVAAYKFLDGLAVQPIGTSRVVRLSFESPDPSLAQKFANAVADTFVALTLERRFEASSYARRFLEDRLRELKVKLEDSERQLVAYAQAQRIVNVDERKTLVATNLESLNAELSVTSRARLTAEQLLRQAEATDGMALPQILNDESVRKMRDRRTELSTEYQDQLSFFKADYPEMLKIKAQIDEIDRQIKASVDIVKQSLQAEYEAAKGQEDNLRQQLEDMKVEALDLDSRGIQYRILQREVDTNRQLYDGLLQRFKEVGVAGAVGTNNVSILDGAELPVLPFKPSLSKNLALTLALGMFFGALAAFGLEYLDDTFKVPEDVEAILGLPVLGLIPVTGKTTSFASAFADPRSPISEAYRSLRTALQFSTADGTPKTLLVTSARPREGKSTTAVALAMNFAQLGHSVLLIDADLRNPSLHKKLNLSSSAGLSNYLTGNALPQGAFQETNQDGLTLMASGPLPPNPAELLAGPRMPSLLNVACERFDLVIVDGPPVMGIADAPLLSSIAGGTLLVIEAGQTRRAATRAALKRLHFARSQMVGVLLNKFNSRNVGHAYGYGYGDGDAYYGYAADPSQKQLEHDSV